MLEKMKEMLAEQLNCEASTITPETSFKDDLGADSLDLFELVMALEDEYNVEIPAEELTDLNTVGDVIDYLKNKEEKRKMSNDKNKICTEPDRKNACR